MSFGESDLLLFDNSFKWWIATSFHSFFYQKASEEVCDGTVLVFPDMILEDERQELVITIFLKWRHMLWNNSPFSQNYTHILKTTVIS